MVEHHSGRVVLIDFGAVQESIKAMGGTTVTGTYGYAPLEQWAGHARPASDVYALAATTLSLITAKAAHELVGTDGTIHWHQVETAASRLSASTRLILEQALHPNPDERPADATVFLQHLQARRAPTPSLSPSKQPPPPPKHLTEPALHLSRNTYSPRIQNPFSWSPILLFLMFTCGNLAFVAAGQGALDVANALLLAPTLGFGAEMILSASKRRKLRRQHQDFRKHAIRVKATLERLETPDVHFSFEDHQGTRHHHIVLLTWLPSGVTRPGDSFWLYVHRHDPTRFAIWLP